MRLVFTLAAAAAMAAAACSDATTTSSSSSSGASGTSGTSGTPGTSGTSGTSGSTTEDASATSSSSGATPTPWQNTVVQEIVANKCAISGCHEGSRAPNFSGISEASMKANITALWEVKAGTMPKRGSLTAAEKAAFIAFYD